MRVGTAKELAISSGLMILFGLHDIQQRTLLLRHVCTRRQKQTKIYLGIVNAMPTPTKEKKNGKQESLTYLGYANRPRHMVWHCQHYQKIDVPSFLRRGQGLNSAAAGPQ